MSDKWAGFLIWLQNFNAKYGVAVIVAAVALILGWILYTVVRTVHAGRYGDKKVLLRGRLAEEKLKERAVSSLQKMISYKTLPGYGDEMRLLCAFIKENYPKLFEKAELRINDCGMLLRLPGKKEPNKKPVMFCGHLDVVPAGEGWTHDPFGGIMDGGKVYGRGACDCKGPVVAMLEAIENLLKSDFCPERDIWFAFGGDEETGGDGGAGEFAEYLKEQGIYFDLILDEGGYIAKSHMGSEAHPAALIGVGEKQTCFCRLTAVGEGGHSGRATGKTALGALAEAVCRIEAVSKRTRVSPLCLRFLKASMPALPFGKRYIVANLPLTRPFIKSVFKKDPEVAFLMKNSIVPTQVRGSAEESNMLASRAECIVNAQLMPGENGEKTLKYIKSLLADLPVNVEMPMPLKTNQADSGDPMYKLLCEVLAQSYPGLPCIEWISSGCSDAVHYTDLSRCILRFSPIVMEKKTALSAHGPDERISAESLASAVEVYIRFMVRL